MKNYINTIFKVVVVVFCSLVVAACGDGEVKKTYSLPAMFQASYYNCPYNCKVEEEEYDKNEKLVKTNTYTFDNSGRLTYICSKEADSNDSIPLWIDYEGGNKLKLYAGNRKTDRFTMINKSRRSEIGTVMSITIGRPGINKTPGKDNRSLIIYLHWSSDNKYLTSFEVEKYFTETTHDSTAVQIIYDDENNMTCRVTRKSGAALEEVIDPSTSKVTMERVYYGKSSKPKKKYTYHYVDFDGDRWGTAYKVDSRGRSGGRIKRQYYIGGVVPKTEAVFTESDIAKAVKPKVTGDVILDYIANVKYKYELNNANNNTPTGKLFIVLSVLTLLFIWLYLYLGKRHGLFENFTGVPNADGMKRTWMFNIEPYKKVTVIILLALLAFVSAVLILLAVGAVTYGVLYAVKYILIAIVWIGWIMLILGVLGVLARVGEAIIFAIIGGIIVYFEDGIREFGDDIVDWGFTFMHDLNIFSWGLGLFKNFWDVILVVYLTPMIIFLAFAALTIILVGLLMVFELLVTRIYSIRRPCPSCGSTKTPEYWVDDHHIHPMALHPGLYGVFHQTNPYTGEKVPTMLLNGKGKLLRRCKDCGAFMKADAEKTFGTEKHIGIVGHRSSGKSYMLYTALGGLKDYFGSRASQMDADYNTNIDKMVARIEDGASIQTMDSDSYRAVQLIVERKKSPIPYHLFFYDVAGEKFNDASISLRQGTKFYQNVQTIVLVIDPAMIDYAALQPSDNLMKWVEQHPSPEHFNVNGTVSALQSILDLAHRDTKDIDLYVVCVKADTGYLEACGYPVTGEDLGIEKFITDELGWSNIVSVAKKFHSVHYDIASVKPEFRERLRNMFLHILKNMGVS